MNVRAAVLAAALVAVASIASAQPPTAIGPRLDYERLTPALTPTEFSRLNLLTLPGSAFTAGWDAIESKELRDGYIARFFYRAVDGLMVGVVEDHFGNVYQQTKAWKMAPGFAQFNVTKFVLPDPTPGVDRPVAILTFFLYNRNSGTVQRFWVAWLDATAHDVTR